MNVILCTDYAEMSRKAADIISDLVAAKPDCTLGLATGSTPLGLYAELVKDHRAGKISFKDVDTFNLDEYRGLDPDHVQSYRYFMRTNLFDHVNIDPARINLPDGTNMDAEAECAHYDEIIRSVGGVDLQLLGTGPNGHIGFNEPGTPWDAVTHIVPLTDATRQANKRFFNSIDEVPEKAVSMGIKTVMQSRRIILMAFGKNKAQAVKGMIEGRIDNSVPASILQLHPDCTVYIDDDAASML